MKPAPPVTRITSSESGISLRPMALAAVAAPRGANIAVFGPNYNGVVLFRRRRFWPAGGADAAQAAGVFNSLRTTARLCRQGRSC
jgi:hypothetical protein